MAEVPQRQLEAERRNELRDRRRVERSPYVLVGLLLALVLGVGLTAAVDLRRLDTPAGAALAWAESAVFGDCPRYVLLSSPDPSGGDDARREQVCRDLAARSADRAAATRVRLLAARPGSAELVVERPGETVPFRVALVRDGRWRVVLDDASCAAVGCP